MLNAVAVLHCLMQQGMTGPGTYLPLVQLLWPYPHGIYHSQEYLEFLCSSCQPEL